MAALGLEGLWGLEQLDRTGIATWKLGLILIGAAGALSYILLTLLSGMEPNPVLKGPPEKDALYARDLVFLTTPVVIALLAVARAIETDLKGLGTFDSVIDTSKDKLRPTRYLLMTCTILGLLIGCLFLPVVISLVHPLNLTVVEAFIALGAGGSAPISAFIMMPISGMILGMLNAVCISQIVCLVHAARHIKIDFLQLNDYAAVANSGVRFFLFIIPVFSFLLLLMFLENDPIAIASQRWVLGFFVFCAVAILIPYAYPVWILRNRIRDKKLEEIDQITRSLRRDEETITTLNIHNLDAPTTAADLLTHQMFLESRWEWPIASHLQKLILFGLLPPLTWVLAAVIENSMY